MITPWRLLCGLCVALLLPVGVAIDGARVEQTSPGTRAPLPIVATFEGLGASFTGPQGTASVRSPSDNSIAVGPDHIVQTVNSRLAVFTKKGKRFAETAERRSTARCRATLSSPASAACAKRATTATSSSVTTSSRIAGSW